jgi:tetratricopeptide (TPR) repeat protein
MKYEKPSRKQEKILQQALILHQNAQLVEAYSLYHKLLKDFPTNFELLCNLGTIDIQQGNFEEGIRFLRESLKISPNQPFVLSNLGFALTQLNRLEEAFIYASQAITLKPDYANGHHNYAVVLIGLNRFEEALVSSDQAIAIEPELAVAHNNRGAVLLQLMRFDEAIDSFERAITLNPGYANAYYNYAVALKDLGRFDEAFDCLDMAIALKPNYVDAYFHRGQMLDDYKKYEDALVDYNQIILLTPNCFEAHKCRGYTLMHLMRMDEAIESCDKAISLAPNFAAAYNIRGIVNHNMLQLTEALDNYDKAIALQSDFAAALLNKSIIKLLIGEYEEGWLLYEWRWQTDFKKYSRNFIQPLWLGEQIRGKIILIHEEQGLGDFIQFCRYIPMLEALGAKVILETPIELISLISKLKGNFTIIPKGQILPNFDFYSPLLSLPLAFKTSFETIPANLPYLYADGEKLKLWQKRLGNKMQPRIGLVWSGSNNHTYDYNRNIPLKLLAPLQRLPFEFHCLQKEIRPDDAKILTHFKRVKTHQNEIIDFSDTAALINEMDIVISVDTSTAHLAGAMGKPVWILLPFSPDFRWMLDKTDSPWYPSASLLRQPAIGDWSSVISDLVKKLETMATFG